MNLKAIWIFICNVTVVVYSLKNTEPIEVETTKENTTQSHVSANDDTEATELEGELFEGDLDISIDTIQQFYEIDEMEEEEIMSTLGGNNESKYTHALGKRAAASDRQIWSGGIVPFTYNSSLSAEVRIRIRKAMDEYENTTCLHFIEHTNQSDYIYFTDAKNNKCSSNSIGRRTGRLIINLSPGCQHHRTILHEIGHALGFWHEHTRPDRDSYITIFEKNIKSGKLHNFLKRKDKTVDYQGSKYDYGSIMHYRKNAFVNASCSGCSTVDVNNTSEYERQGSPNIGRERHLSINDIEQTNRLYSCPMPGEQGTLAVYIQYGENLENTDTTTNDADPYVRVTAVSSTGEKEDKETMTQKNNLNPIWKEWLFFSDRQWQFFRIRVWDSDFGRDDPMSMSETLPLLNQGSFANGHTHCANTICDHFIKYDYKLLKRVCGNLQVNIQYANNLTDLDGTLTVTKPYVVVTAVRPNGTFYSKRTESKENTFNLVWNQLLDMGNGGTEWVAFQVQMWDENSGSDKAISDPEAVDIYSGHNSSIQHCVSSSCSSYLYLDFNLTYDNCHCQNGGTCQCTGCECICICDSPYTGTYCEHKEGSLLVYAYYGSGLPNKDGLGNISDPYIEFIAYDVYGESYRMTTQTSHNSESPTWKQKLHFGTHTWKNLDVKVWDEDSYTDDPLSTTQTWNLLPSLSPFSVIQARVIAYTGWVRFDYYMST